MTSAREKASIKGPGEKTLGQPIHGIGGQTLGMGGAAPGADDHGSAPGAAREEVTAAARV